MTFTSSGKSKKEKEEKESIEDIPARIRYKHSVGLIWGIWSMVRDVSTSRVYIRIRPVIQT
jgi:hypothetical protein